jgi:hypothetical protein
MPHDFGAYMTRVAEFAEIMGLGAAVWGLIAGIFFWRSRARRHHFSKVYFPKDPSDFYAYYVDIVGKAGRSVYITSDGFNMCNPASRDAAAKMSAAQSRAIARGAVVVRYQMLDTMHLNWLAEIVRMKRAHGDSYRTLINRTFEHCGNFAVIDSGTRRAVVEFMFTYPGGLSQATTARDFGFVHGHQAKADDTKAFFDRLMAHEATVEITEDNFEQVARHLFEERVSKHFLRESDFHIFDEEILTAQKRIGRRRVCFEDVKFYGWSELQCARSLPEDKEPAGESVRAALVPSG